MKANPADVCGRALHLSIFLGRFVTVNSYKQGFKDGIPIALGYLAVSFSFGILGVKYGLSIWQTVLISMTNLTSAGQFAGIGIIAAAGSYVEMFISQLVINLRYSLMSIAMSQKVDRNFGTGSRLTLGFSMTDEIFAVASSRGSEVGRKYFLGLATAPYFGWALGTLLGGISGDILPQRICTALGVALYGMFVAIVVPPMKNDRHIALVVAVAIALSCVLYYQPLFEISSGFQVIICAVVASAVGTFIFPVSDDEQTAESSTDINTESGVSGQ